MSVCPKCKTEQSRRKNGKCPNCDTEIEIYKGRWYEADLQSPPMKIIGHFEKLVSQEQFNMRCLKINFQIPKKGERFKRELLIANNILDMTDGDIDLSKQTLDFMFTDPCFRWRNRISLIPITNEFRAALQIVRARKELNESIKKRQKEVKNFLEVRGSVFNK